MVGLLAVGCQHTLSPDNGRCGPTPRLLVGAGAYPAVDASAAVQSSVTGMVLSGADLYFVVSNVGSGYPDHLYLAGAVMHVSTHGGASTQLAGGYVFQTPLLTPTSVIVGETAAPGTAGDGGIALIPRGGGSSTTLVTFTGTALTAGPASDGTSVYYADSAGVESVPLAPATAPALPTRLSPLLPNNLGVFGSTLLMLLSTGAIETIPIAAGDAGAESSLGSGLPSTAGTLIACGDDACWLAGGDIDEIAPTGGTLGTTATLTGPVAAPTSLVFDGTNFFVAGTAGSPNGTGTIARVPRQGGPQVEVATLPSSGPIAVDDACVYFATSTGIFSLQKNAEGVVLP